VSSTQDAPDLRKLSSGNTLSGDPEIRGLVEWIPKAGLMAEDGGVGDVFWKPVYPNGAEFKSPVDDPLYSAHQKVQGIRLNITRYLPDYPAKAVGCLQQVKCPLSTPEN
jgi:hypothetical protein